MDDRQLLQFVGEASSEQDAAERCFEAAQLCEDSGDAARAGVWLQRALDIINNGGFLVNPN